MSNHAWDVCLLIVFCAELSFGAEPHDSSVPSGPTIWYVDWAASGQNDGSSWADAFTDLQDAIAVAARGDEIWITAGTYKPDRGTGDRTMAFVLPCGVSVYGGFAGTEECLDERDIETNETILSADLNDDDGPWNCPDVSTCCAYDYQGVGCDDPQCEAMICGYKSECCIAQKDPDYWRNHWAPLAWFACCHLGTWGTCDDSYRAVAIEECDGVLLDGVVLIGGYYDTIRDGYIDHYPSYGASLASWNASYSLAHSTIRGYGARGIFADSGSHLGLFDCLIQDRNVAVQCGSIEEQRCTATVERCHFESTDFDGWWADTTIRDSSFAKDWSSADIYGDANIESCEFRDTAGLDLSGGRFSVSNCSFLGAGRLSTSSGVAIIDNSTFIGGVSNAVFSGAGGLIRNSIFLNNANSAIQWSFGGLTVLNCTIVGNGFENFPGGSVGGAIYLQGHVSAQVLNSILWGNGWGHASLEDNQIVVRPDFDESLEIDYSIVEGWTGKLGGPGNTGNSGLDPMLANPDGPDGIPGTEDDNARLRPGSPLINAGFPSSYLLPTDLDGHARVLCGAVDIGAYEFGAGDFNCDQAVDLLDHAVWQNCMTNPNPSTVRPGCEAFDFNADSDIDLADYAYLQRDFVAP